MDVKELQVIAERKLNDAVRAHGAQKVIARDLNMSDAELSRLLHEQAPRVLKVMSLLGLTIVDANFVDSLKAVLKETL